MEDESLTNVGSPETPCRLNKAIVNKEQDRFLPVANVGRIMKKVLPTSGKISKDAKETVQECVSEFISFITGEASDKCQREKRKTINGDDVIWAITTLGFEDYAAPLKAYLDKYRDTEGDRANVPINRHSQRMQLLQQQQQQQQQEEAGNIDVNNNNNNNNNNNDIDMNYSCCSDDNNNGVYSSSYMGSVGCDHYQQQQPLLPAFAPTSIYQQQQQQRDQVNSLGQW